MIEAFHILINQVCLQPILESRYWHLGSVVLASYLIAVVGEIVSSFSGVLEKMNGYSYLCWGCSQRLWLRSEVCCPA